MGVQNMFQSKVILTLAILGSLGLSGLARANAFLYSNGVYIPVIAPGAGAATEAYGINDAGEIVGVGTPFNNGFVESNGTFTVLPQGSNFAPTGINNTGQIVAYRCPAFCDGYLDVGGVLTTIDFPGSASTQLTGINNAGQILGTTYGGPNEGFVYSNGTFTSINVPTGNPFTTTEANGINDAGQVVGSYTDSLGKHGFLDSNGIFQTIDFPGSTYTILQGINNAGQIVGWYSGGNPVAAHGFIYANGVFTPIDAPFQYVNSTQARGINNLGDVVGVYSVSPPVITPEPASAWLLGCGLGWVAMQFLKRRRTI
jgi:probable HAF family extracellular repeat protein